MTNDLESKEEAEGLAEAGADLSERHKLATSQATWLPILRRENRERFNPTPVSPRRTDPCGLRGWKHASGMNNAASGCVPSFQSVLQPITQPRINCFPEQFFLRFPEDNYTFFVTVLWEKNDRSVATLPYTQ